MAQQAWRATRAGVRDLPTSRLAFPGTSTCICGASCVSAPGSASDDRLGDSEREIRCLPGTGAQEMESNQIHVPAAPVLGDAQQFFAACET
jgi:hypothetical protein